MDEIMLKALFVLCIVLTNAAGHCRFSETYIAKTSPQSLFYYMHSNENCLLKIKPHSLYSDGYYLEIRWINFNIEGNMPSCSDDFMEVFLTRYSMSIGKYCSSNLGNEGLFDMYSIDGHAAFRFKSDGCGKNGVAGFSYQLKSYDQQYRGIYGRSICYREQQSPYDGIFYTSGWPKGYRKGDDCYQSLRVPDFKHVRFALMDLNLQRHPVYDNDYFQIKESSKALSGASSILNGANDLTAKFYGVLHPSYFTGTKTFAYVYLHKRWGSYPSYSNRGLMIGFVFYGKNKDGINACQWGNNSAHITSLGTLFIALMSCVALVLV